MLVVYSKNNCNACVQAKALLDKNDLKYEVRNTDEDFDAFDFIISQNHRSFPQIYNANGTLFVNGGFAGLKQWAIDNDMKI